MNTYELYKKSEEYLKYVMKKSFPEASTIFLFGSRVYSKESRSADIDIGIIDPTIDHHKIEEVKDTIRESFVPWDVDIVDFANADANFKKVSLHKTERWK